jgi:hypothetical protein
MRSIQEQQIKYPMTSIFPLRFCKDDLDRIKRIAENKNMSVNKLMRECIFNQLD